LKPDKSFQGDYAPSFPSQRAWGRWSKPPNEDQVLRKKVLYLSFEDVLKLRVVHLLVLGMKICGIRDLRGKNPGLKRNGRLSCGSLFQSGLGATAGSGISISH